MVYHIFDTPDYKDGYKKVWWATKVGFAFSGAYTLYDLIAISRPVTLRQLYSRLFFVLLPLPFATAIGATSLFTVANLRGKKDDWINYIPAGMSTGMIIGIQSRSPLFGIYSGIFFSLLGIFAKQADKHNFKTITFDQSFTKMQFGLLKPYPGIDATLGLKREDPGRLPLDL